MFVRNSTRQLKLQEAGLVGRMINLPLHCPCIKCSSFSSGGGGEYHIEIPEGFKEMGMGRLGRQWWPHVGDAKKPAKSDAHGFAQ